jgi:hypothetical protein
MIIPDARWEMPELLMPGKKPVGPVKIDWSHPLTRELRFCDIAGAGDLVSGSAPSVDNTTKKGSSDGLVLVCSTSQINRQYDFDPLKTSSGDGLGNFTMVVRGNPFATTTSSHAFVQKADDNGSPFNQVGLYFNTNASFGGTNASFAFIAYDGGTSAVASAGQIDSEFHTFAGHRVGTAMFIYRDGVALATASPAVRDIYDGNRRIAIGSNGSSGANAYLGDITFAMAWDRALTDIEHASLAADPYQFLIPA